LADVSVEAIAVFGVLSEQADVPAPAGVLPEVVARGLRSGGQRGEALECPRDGGGPGPVGGQVQRELAGVAGEFAGDVEQSVAQPLGLADGVLAVKELEFPRSGGQGLIRR
jgi:hypothetical protein